MNAIGEVTHLAALSNHLAIAFFCIRGKGLAWKTIYFFFHFVSQFNSLHALGFDYFVILVLHQSYFLSHSKKEIMFELVLSKIKLLLLKFNLCRSTIFKFHFYDLFYRFDTESWINIFSIILQKLKFMKHKKINN